MVAFYLQFNSKSGAKLQGFCLILRILGVFFSKSQSYSYPQSGAFLLLRANFYACIFFNALINKLIVQSPPNRCKMLPRNRLY